ncbi:MAG: translation initiation factor IF-2 [Candidatus Paceibacterota bacterium]
MTEKIQDTIERPPVVAIMGHIDHGKSTLLDYIRATKVVEKEAGGITQHISAYEVVHKKESGEEKKITFLDTPGHEAFSKMRSRGGKAADIAILVVSSEDGVKAQTLEALSSIKNAGVPYIVALTKIDKQNANVERVKQNLLENEIYLEGFGGSIPYVPVSSKTGEGIPELLDMLLLVAELEEFKGSPEKLAEGVVIESNRDPKRGIVATLVIKDGTLKSGMFIVAGEALSPVRIFEDFNGESIKEATFSAPVQIVGFDEVPPVGAPFKACHTKKEAEALKGGIERVTSSEEKNDENKKVIPLVIKADVLGSLEAIEYELEKMKSDRISLRVLHRGVGAITENDVQILSGSDNGIIAGFGVDADSAAKEYAERLSLPIGTFSIIYELSEWIGKMAKERTPKMKVEELTGVAKIVRTFSAVKEKQVVGGKVQSGVLKVKETVNITRRENKVGTGVILNLQQQRAETKEVSEGQEFGAQIQSKISIAPGDVIEAFIVVEK